MEHVKQGQWPVARSEGQTGGTVRWWMQVAAAGAVVLKGRHYGPIIGLRLLEDKAFNPLSILSASCIISLEIV